MLKSLIEFELELLKQPCVHRVKPPAKKGVSGACQGRVRGVSGACQGRGMGVAGD